MAYDFDGSTSYLELGSALKAAAPLTLACWFNSDSITAIDELVSINNGAGTTSYFALEAAGTIGGDPLRAVAGSSAGSSQASTATGYVANRWTHGAAVFASSTSRTAYIDGMPGTTDTATRTPGAISVSNIGCYATGGARARFFDGRIAEAAIWGCELNPTELREAAAGKPHNLIRPESLLLYMPLSKETMLAELSRLGSVFANTAALPVSDHPGRLIVPRKRKVWLVSAPSSGRTLSGTLVEANDTASVSTSVKVSATAALVEAGDTASIAASVKVSATAALVEAGDTASINASVGDSRTLSGALVEAGDTDSIAASVKVLGTAALAELADVPAIAAAVRVAGAAMLAEGADRSAGLIGGFGPAIVDPNYLFLAPPRARRAIAHTRLRLIRAFPRIRVVIAAKRA